MKYVLILLLALVSLSCSKKITKVEGTAPAVIQEKGMRYGKGTFADEQRESERLVVYFDFNSAVLRQESIAEIAGFIRGKKIEGGILCVGHACPIGTDEYNLALSNERAYAVKNIYVKMGIPYDAIVTMAKGENQPVTNIEQEYHLNRRVEITFR
jgi:outer membrane protein OmpA-like peptidoglycan-associated protein